ncbi:MAG: DUF1638 domain-containing protein [Kiritimatiellae bacterium]|nr:DUF1638 domain-containing protein [Kiritimatiellia bacterium]
MLLKLIACEVFTREICTCVARTPHPVDLEFTPKDAHNDADVLRRLLQERINVAGTSERHYDAIALCLGLCGNSTVGLVSPSIPLVIPRVHDCCALFLGSQEMWKQHFGDAPSTPFSSVGYMEHGGELIRDDGNMSQHLGISQSYEEFVEQYGEENAAYLWETLNPKHTPGEDDRVVFIDIPESPGQEQLAACRKRAEEQGKTFVKLDGSVALIRDLVDGNWDESRFLVVPPGHTVAAVYDYDTVIKAVE